MADHNQFGSTKPTQSGDPKHCAQCEAMLTDALDGTLTAAEQTAFDLHLISCAPCSEMVADAQRGAAWLELLKSPRPEPPSALLERIFAQTSGANVTLADSKSAAAHSGSAPYLVPSNTLLGRPTLAIASTQAGANVLPFRSRVAASFNLRSIGHTLLQPRLAMTAAMAFFSVALTMNLTGIKLSELHASDLRPSSLKRSLSEANAHVVRYYDNLRVVYELESRVHDLQSSSDNDTPAKSSPADSDSKPSGNQPNQQNPDQPAKEARPRPKPGTSRREDPQVSLRYAVAQVDIDATDFIPTSAPVQPARSTLAVLFPSLDLPNTFNNSPQSIIDSKVQEARLV